MKPSGQTLVPEMPIVNGTSARSGAVVAGATAVGDAVRALADAATAVVASSAVVVAGCASLLHAAWASSPGTAPGTGTQ